MSGIDRERPPEEMLDLELDRAIDALNREQRPEPRASDPEQYWDALDAAMLLRSTEPPTPPDGGFADSLAARLARDDPRPSVNGHVQQMLAGSQPVPAAARWRSMLMPAAQAAGACAMAGMVAGVLVGGVGGRVVMLISGEMFSREHPNIRIATESSGRRVGEFTWSGTFDLIAEAMVYGLIGGLFYFVARRWLPRSTRYEGLLFGVLLLLIAGATIISAGNSDFDRIGSPLVNVLMFASLFVLFGLVIGPLARWLERLRPRAEPRIGAFRSVIGWVFALVGGFGLVIAALLVVTGLVVLGVALGHVGSGDVPISSLAAVVAIGATLVVLPVSRVVVAMLEHGRTGSAARIATFDAIGWWALWVGVLSGAVLVILQVAEILDLA